MNEYVQRFCLAILCKGIHLADGSMHLKEKVE